MLFLVSWDAQTYGRVRWRDWLFEDYRPVTSIARALNVATRLQICGVVYGVFHFPKGLGSYLLDKVSTSKLVLRISYFFFIREECLRDTQSRASILHPVLNMAYCVPA